MKLAIILLVTGLLLVILFFSKTYFKIHGPIMDIMVMDTYFVTRTSHVVLALVLFFGTLFTLGGAISYGLASKGFLYSFIALVIIDALLVFRLINMFEK
jgi:hypothetical protein